MVIAIFGASGGIGKLLVRQALDEGHKVTAYIRNQSNFNVSHQNLKTVVGELSDYENIESVIAGADCVISTLGPPVKRNYEGFSVLIGHENIIKAMQNRNVKRFITLATPSVSFEKDVRSFATIVPGILGRVFLPKAYQEIVRIGNIVKTSGLDWTIVRIIAPKNSAATGKVIVSFGETKVKFSIPRADIADFMLRIAKEKQYIRSMPIIGT